jgi:hypothetical protein
MEVKQAIDHYVLQKYYEIVCCAFFGFHNIKILATENHGDQRVP